FVLVPGIGPEFHFPDSINPFGSRQQQEQSACEVSGRGEPRELRQPAATHNPHQGNQGYGQWHGMTYITSFKSDGAGFREVGATESNQGTGAEAVGSQQNPWHGTAHELAIPNLDQQHQQKQCKQYGGGSADPGASGDAGEIKSPT